MGFNYKVFIWKINIFFSYYYDH